MSSRFRVHLLRAGSLLLAIVLLVAGSLDHVHEAWSKVCIGGSDVGYFHQVVDAATVDGQAGTETTIDVKMVIARLNAKIEINNKAAYRETAEGRLLDVRFESSSSAMKSSFVATVGDKAVLVKSATGDREYVRETPYLGVLLGPEGIRRSSRDALKKVGDVLEYQTFAEEMGAVVKVTRLVLAAAPAGTPEPPPGTILVKEEIAGVALRTIWLDHDDYVVRYQETGPFGEFVIERCDPENARKAASGAELPAQMYERAVVRSNVRIPQARAVESMRIRIMHHKPDLGWPDLKSHDQRVVEQSKDAVTLEIRRRPAPAQASSRPVAITDANREHLEPNAVINSDDPEVRRVAGEVAGSEPNAYKAALLLRDWVADQMTFDPGVALAPATEVIRNRRGTCAAYASVLTALCRAAGIPARYVMGFVYLDGAWGGHAWTEVQIGEEWVPIDSAIVSPGPADAARFRFVTSSLREGAGVLAPGGQKLYGQIGIEVLSYDVSGRNVKLLPGAPLSYVHENRFTSVGLDLTLSKPEGFAFEGLDAAWPDSTLVRMTGPQGRKCSVIQDSLRPGVEVGKQCRTALEKILPSVDCSEVVAVGRKCYRVVGEGKAALAIPYGLDLWILVAEGDDAPGLLASVARSFSGPSAESGSR